MDNCDPFVTVAIAQFSMASDSHRNLQRAAELVREAVARGAEVVLLPELFAHQYFPRERRREYFDMAKSLQQSDAVHTMAELARDLGVVIPVSFYEKAPDGYFNSLALLDAGGGCLGVYRKSHIPDGAGYDEKYYFQPGNTGFRAFRTGRGNLGVGVCWDQWFPECARALALQGADLLLFPTAIGSEPEYPEYDTREPWKRAMIGHAASNAVAICAANRVGEEGGLRFYGSSFIADHRGETVAALGRDEEGIAVARLNLENARAYRKWLGVLTDRRPELYGALTHPVKAS